MGVTRDVIDGRAVAVKRGAGVTDEAAGLARLAVIAGTGGPRVPEVISCDGDILVTEWLDSGSRTPAQESALGAALAVLHSTPAGEWGGGSSWIGDCPIDPAPASTAARFYGRRLSSLASRCGLAGPVEAVVGRLETLIPPGPPAVLHGDLWWGNVGWGLDGQPFVLDPSVHGGHPEEDLAMLALFGPVPPRLYDAYRDRRTLDDGWEDRVALWQLYPLLVHTVLFGGSYRTSALDAARRYAPSR